MSNSQRISELPAGSTPATEIAPETLGEQPDNYYTLRVETPPTSGIMEVKYTHDNSVEYIYVQETPDETSSLECPSRVVPRQIFYCFLYPKREGQRILAKGHHFHLKVNGYGNIASQPDKNEVSDVFEVSVVAGGPYRSTTISDVYLGGIQSDSIRIVAAGKLVSRGHSDDIPTAIAVPAAGRFESVGGTMESREVTSLGCSPIECFAVTLGGLLFHWTVSAPAPVNVAEQPFLFPYLSTFRAHFEQVLYSGGQSYDVFTFLLASGQVVAFWRSASTGATVDHEKLDLPFVDGLAVGDTNIVLAAANKTVYSWRYDESAVDLFLGRRGPPQVPTKIESNQSVLCQSGNVTVMVSGRNFGIIVCDNDPNEIYSWGAGLANTELTADVFPQLVSNSFGDFWTLPHSIKEVKVSDAHVVALMDTGKLWVLPLGISEGSPPGRFKVLQSSLLDSVYLDHVVATTQVDAVGVTSTEILFALSNSELGMLEVLSQQDTLKGDPQPVEIGIDGYPSFMYGNGDLLFVGMTAPEVMIELSAGSGDTNSTTSNNITSRRLLATADPATRLFEAMSTVRYPGARILLPPGVYNIPQSLPVHVSDILLSFSGSSGDPAAVLNCGGNQCFNITAPGLSIEGITIQNGYSSYEGGVVALPSRSSVSFTQVRFINNTAGVQGGVLSAADGCDIVVNECVFEENTAVESGGSIHMGPGSYLNIEKTVFNQSIAREGGAVRASSGATVELREVHVDGCVADLNGGGFSVVGSINVYNSTFQGCQASDGAAIFARPFGTIISFVNCTFRSNVATSSGVLRLRNAEARVEDCLFENNYADLGGSLSCYDDTPILVNRSRFISNTALKGAGIDSCGGVVDSSSFEANHAFENGGGVYADTSPIEVFNSIFKQNFAKQGSAAFLNEITSGNLDQNQYINNTAAQYGTVAVSRMAAIKSWNLRVKVLCLPKIMSV